MNIYGYNKTTLLDYPEHVAATVFCGGCNFRCPFCHNGSLVLLDDEQERIDAGEILAHLEKRKGMLQGVCITGGEPTLQPDLLSFIRKVKTLGYPVKLDTNGSRPDVLKQLMSLGLLDYVAMDIKASRENYSKAAGIPQLNLEAVDESIAVLKNSGIFYEFRTTVVKGIHSVEEFENIGRWLAGSRAYYLQGYQQNQNVIAPEGLGDFSKEEMLQMANLAGRYIDKVELRGVE